MTARNKPTTSTFDDIQTRLMKVSSLSTVLGWATVGQSYAGKTNDPNHNIGEFDAQNVTQIMVDMLIDVSSDLHDLESSIRQEKEAGQVQIKKLQCLLEMQEAAQ